MAGRKNRTYTVTKPDAKVAVAYLRLSKDESGTKAKTAGTKAQEDAIKAWAAREGVAVITWHHDIGVSGGLPPEERPGLTAALDEMKELGAGVLIVAKLDRLARDMMVAGMIEALVVNQGAKVISATGEGTEGDEMADPSLFLMRSLHKMFAQYERMLIRSRTKKALAAKKARGERVGSIPYGKMLAADGKTLVDHKYEQQVIACVRAYDRRGFKSSEIGYLLVKNGYYPRVPTKPWHHEQIKRILAIPEEVPYNPSNDR